MDDDDDDAEMIAIDEEGSGDEEEMKESEEEDDEEYEQLTMTEGDEDAKYDKDLDLEEDQKIFEKMKEERQHVMFPDEIDTPQDTTARTRFQRCCKNPKYLDTRKVIVINLILNS